MKITKVYTRRGDSGQTDLIGGVRVSKTSARLEAYGTIDELGAHIGLLLALLPSDEHPTTEGDNCQSDDDRQLLLRTANNLFRVGAYLATDQSQTPLYDSAKLPEGETRLLEERIDQIMALLPEPQGFILPGGTVAAAQAHVCRTVCRRAERRIIALMEQAVVEDNIIQYVNRLSDYLFVLAKKVNFNNTVDEILWQNDGR